MDKKGFQLRSGNRPSFLKMSGASPFQENTENNTNNNEETTDKSTDPEQEDVKMPENPDKPLSKVGKVLFNSIAGGLNAIQKNKIKKLKINFGHNEAKRKKEADAKDAGSNAVNDIMKGTGIWKPIVPFDPNKSKK
tara:strand:- start:2 stop:409 length:408 start_codon:yes stop_codon:yes gene_type:complete